MSLVIVIGAAIVTAALVRKLVERPVEVHLPVRIDQRTRRR